MLTISYNGNHIPIEEGTSIKFKWVNPACYFDQIPGDVGLGIDIPVNEFSRTIFGNPERFEKYSSGSDRKFQGLEIRFSGLLLMTGTYNITNATNEKYTGWLQSEIGVLGEKQRDKFITDLPWATDNYFSNLINYDEMSGHEYATIEVVNPVFWEGIGPEQDVNVWSYDEDGELKETQEKWSVLRYHHRKEDGFKINRGLDGGFINTEGKAPVVSPYLFFNYTLREILQMNGLYLDKNCLSADKYPSLVIYNNFNIMKFEYILVSTEVVRMWKNPWEEWIFEPPPIEMTWRVHQYWWEMQAFNYVDLLPRISLKDFLLGIQNFFNVFFFLRSDMKVDLIDRNEILSLPAVDISPFLLGNWQIGERKDISLKFKSEYDKDDAMFSQDYHDVTERREFIKEAVEDKASLDAIENPDIGEIRLVKSLNKYFEYKWDVYAELDKNNSDNQINILQWVFISNGPQPYIYGTAEEIEEIKTCISTIQMEKYNSMSKKPTVMQKGNLSHMRNVWNNFSLRLMFYAGGHFGGSHTADDEHSLNWDGDNGLFEKRWKIWAKMWANRLSVEADFNLPLNLLIFMKNNIYKKFRTENGEFIIEEMEVEIGLHMIGKTTIKGYKL